MAGGWIVSVLIETGADAPERQFFVVAQEDRARAEWAAADVALSIGSVATSPASGVEPVAAIGEATDRVLDRFGLSPGGIKALGSRWPRALLAPGTPKRAEG
jgi:hypothetical protein